MGEAQLAAPPGPVVFTREAGPDTLLNDLGRYPHAFLLACLMDRQVAAERAWKVPWIVRQSVGSFEFAALAALTEGDWLAIMTGPPAAHRLPNKMASVARRAVARVADRYAGDASAIWSGSPPSVRVVRRFLEFYGAGSKIATMAANILARDFRVPMADYRAIDISADVQVLRVMARLGLVEEGAGVDVVIYAARELHPDFPGIFDLALWDIGRKVCRPKDPRCADCELRSLCAYGRATP